MIVMPANATGIHTGYLARQYERAPARLGHLYSTGKGARVEAPLPFMPYALDNGAFGCFKRRVAYEQPMKVKQGKRVVMRSTLDDWRELIAWARNAGQQPMWALVPDVVADREATLRAWDLYAPELAAMGWPLAFAAQDGMTFDDVPGGASVVFLGGSPKWKWASLFAWCAHFPRVHVGRANGLRYLRLCARAGAESCDGTGHFRTTRQRRALTRFLAEMNGEASPDENLSWLSDDTEDGTAA